MTEEQPFKDADDMEPIRLPLEAPHGLSTLDTPVDPDAIKLHDAAIRKHLQDRKPREDRPDT